MKKNTSPEQLFQEIQQILCEHLGADPSQVTESAELVSDLNASAGEIEEIIGQLETKYQVHIANAVSELRTVHDLVNAVGEALNEFF